MDCHFCDGIISLGDTELGLDIKLISNIIRIQGYNPMGWRKESRFYINFCPICGRELDVPRELERDTD